MLIAALLSAALAHASEMETDRPDRTESSVTVDKGHFQLELEAASYTRTVDGEDKTSFGSFEARYGVSDRADVQIQFEPDNDKQAGDTTLRLKVNLSKEPGLALIPYITLPKEAQHVRGGLLAPMKMMLPHDIELAFEVGVEQTDDAAKFISSYSFGHKIGVEALHGYLEFYSESQPRADWIATVDTGFTYQLDDNNQVDAGVNVGASPAADPWNPFVGYSVRF